MATTTATVTGTVVAQRLGDDLPLRVRHHHGLRPPDGREAGGPGDGSAAAEANLETLTADTTYHYRIVATSAAGTTMGADKTLRTQRTARAPARVAGLGRAGRPAVGGAPRPVDPNDGETRYRFEYGST